MKLELPLAILLLAIGGWHWMSNITPAYAPSTSIQQGSRSTDSQTQSQPGTPANSVQLAAFQEPVNQLPAVGPNFEPTSNQPAILLAQAAKKLELSPPIACKSRCQIHLFGQTLVGEGNYYQKGEGSGLTRLEISYDISPELTFESTQVCDGKFYYWIQNLGDDRTIEFIDLQRLQTGSSGNGSLPSEWFARSGTAGLLRNLSAAFEFEEPLPTKLGENDMLLLKGKWKRKALENILHGQISQDEEAPIRWDQIPGQLPHSVEVHLGTDDFLHLFPYRISFYKFDKNGNRDESPTMTLELYKVQKLAKLPDELFQVDSDGSQQIDLSGNYRDHIEYLARMIDEAELR